MKNKSIKIILYLILAIFILFCTLVVFFVVRDLGQEDDLRNNIKELNEMFSKNDLDVNKINKNLKTYVTTEENLKLEKAVKKYYKDAFSLVLDINYVLTDKKITSLLNKNNVLNDMPDFTYSKNYIEKTKQTINKSIEDVKSFQSQNNLMSYYKDENLDSYYKDLYIELTSMFNYFGDSKSYETDMNELINQLNAINDILNFLSENYGSWVIVDDTYYFEDENLLKEFKRLLSKVEFNNKEEYSYESIKY